jgi:hypothetical protein
MCHLYTLPPHLTDIASGNVMGQVAGLFWNCASVVFKNIRFLLKYIVDHFGQVGTLTLTRYDIKSIICNATTPILKEIGVVG